jgi:hypothetical protein
VELLEGTGAGHSILRWQKLSRWAFGKDYAASIGVDELSQPGWPADACFDARELAIFDQHNRWVNHDSVELLETHRLRPNAHAGVAIVPVELRAAASGRAGARAFLEPMTLIVVAQRLVPGCHVVTSELVVTRWLADHVLIERKPLRQIVWPASVLQVLREHPYRVRGTRRWLALGELGP